MRPITSTERATLSAPQLKISVRIYIADADGNYHDLSDLGAVDWLGKIRWERNPDSPVMSGTVELRRDAKQGGATGLFQSLSPLMQGSPLNRRADGSYGPVLDAKHGIIIQTAQTPWRVAPIESDYREVFRGLIDGIAFNADPMVLSFRDIGSRLQSTQIEVVRPYGSASGVPLATVMQQILNDNGCSDITLYVPDPPTILLRTQNVPLGSIMDALNSLALQSSGSSVRYQYDSTGAFRLTLVLPPRNKTAVDATFGPDEYLDIPQAEINSANIRNVVKVTFTNSATGLGDSVTVTDAVSISKYGRAFMQLAEDATSAIDTPEEATALANAALSDLSSPPFEQQMRTIYWWPAEPGDLYTYLANGTHYDVDQALASQTVAHELDQGHGYTTIGARAKPAGAYTTWLVLGDSPGSGPVLGPIVGPSLNVVATPGATQYSIAYGGDGVLLSIDGAPTFSAAPPSPIIVARSPSGGVDHVYTFRGDKNGQSVTDAVTIPAIGKDTVTPDLVVTPGAMTDVSEAFGVSSSNPSGSAVPVITVTTHNTTANIGANQNVQPDTPTVAVSGTAIVITRPAYGSLPSSVTIRAEITGGGAETIMRTIVARDKTKFGPDLVVTYTEQPTTYSISATGDRVRVFIDGVDQGEIAFPTFTVTRDAPGGVSHAYRFTGTDSGQTISQSVIVPPQTGLNRAGNLTTGVEYGGTVAGTPSDLVGRGNTGVWQEAWTSANALDAWNIYESAGGCTVVPGGRSGGNRLRMLGQSWIALNKPIAFDPTKLYRMRIVAYDSYDGGDTGGTGPSGFLVGVEGVAANGSTRVSVSGANTASNQHYVVRSGEVLPYNGAAWETFTGFFRGLGTGAHEAPDATNPSPLYPGVSYFRPLVAANYGGSASAEVFVDLISIDVLDEDSSARIYTLADPNGRVSKLNLLPMGKIGGLGWSLNGAQWISPTTFDGTNWIANIASVTARIGTKTITYPAQQIYTNADNVSYYVYNDDPDFTGAWNPQFTQTASDIAAAEGRQYIGTFTTGSHSGSTVTAPAPAPQPGGPTCCAPETLILLDDGGRIRAGDIRAGCVLYTQHEHTLEWGNHRVTHVSGRDAERWKVVLTDGRELIATANHRVCLDKGVRAWTRIDALLAGDRLVGVVKSIVLACYPFDFGPVIKLTVEDAHTYV
ncbi:MAG: Hint domain-containing protein, partial [Gemmatimonadaceae bacterium]